MIFNYNIFYNWYQNHFDDPTVCEKTDDLVVFFYNPTFKTNPKSGGKKQYFEVRRCQRIAKLRSIEPTRLFPNGMYIVGDYENAMGEKWLLFVYPEQPRCNRKPEDGQYADHYAFCSFTKDSEKIVCFNDVGYHIKNRNLSLGYSVHFLQTYKDNTPFTQELLEDDEYRKDNLLMRKPFIETNKTGADHSDETTFSPVIDCFRNKKFSAAFSEFKIASIVVIGFKGHFTVFLYDNKFNNKSNNMNLCNAKACYFQIGDDIVSHSSLEVIVRSKIIDLFKRYFITK